MKMWPQGRSAQLRNCVFSGNRGYSLIEANNVFLLCCTSVDNHWGTDAIAVASHWYDFIQITVRNCIIWDSNASSVSPFHDNADITYSNLYVAWQGEGNVQVDPLFVDADGPDDIIGTEDDDLRLLPDSPCINRGINSNAAASLLGDIEGRPRVLGVVDMGAHEQGRVWHVDAIGGSDDNNGATILTALKTLSHAVSLTGPGDLILLQPGLYQESVDLAGRAIALRGLPSPKGIAVIEAPNSIAIRMSPQEGPKSLLENLVIRNSQTGISVEQGSSILRNLTLVGNDFGIEAVLEAEPGITNCILWGNREADLVGCKASYSCIEHLGQAQGTGNLSLDPLFADIHADDFHLRSQQGRFSPVFGTYVHDAVSSPCIDGGSPYDWVGAEPRPNGHRVNMGAYGGTAYASLSRGRSPIIEIVDVQADLGQVTVQFRAWDSDGKVVAIRCAVNGVDVGLVKENDALWELSGEVDPAEFYLITATAIDDQGNTATAEPVYQVQPPKPAPPPGPTGPGRAR